METTQKSLRMHIGIVGRTNVGKSSFLNMIAGQDVAITSPIAGTTTDAVEKSMELLPLGPVVIVDTAGIDDASLLAEARTNRTRKALTRIDAVVLIVEPNIWTSWEEELIGIAGERHLPIIIAVNKTDRCAPDEPFMAKLKAASPLVFRCSCTDSLRCDHYVTLFKNLLAEAAKSYRREPPLIAALWSLSSLSTFRRRVAGSLCRRCRRSAKRSTATQWRSPSRNASMPTPLNLSENGRIWSSAIRRQC
jgi:small GTP-binding protein